MTKTLTGETQYRTHSTWRKEFLVLQVEEHSKGTYFSDDDLTDLHGRDYDNTYWRDATIEDLQKLMKMESKQTT